MQVEIGSFSWSSEFPFFGVLHERDFVLNINASFSAQSILLPCIMELTMRNTGVVDGDRVLPNINRRAGSSWCLKRIF